MNAKKCIHALDMLLLESTTIKDSGFCFIIIQAHELMFLMFSTG